jgi:pilus assembly protein CpaB
VSTRSILIGVLALTFGGSAAIGVNLLYRQHGDAGAETVQVVVAKADIPRGVKVMVDNLTLRSFPKDAVPPGALTELNEVSGRVACQSFVKDEPVLDQKLTRGLGGLAALIPPGMRAFTIQTANVTTQVAGFLLPGNKVDVLLTTNGSGPNDRSGGGVTTTLLQNVEILAVDNRLDAPPESRVDIKNMQSVTLLVTPDQAAKLDLGQNRGTLHLSLRHPDDTSPANTRPATLSDLQFQQEMPWGQQLALIVEAFGKWKSKPAKEPKTDPLPPAPAKEEAGTPPAPLEIRTLRGTYYGVVQVDPLPVGNGR